MARALSQARESGNGSTCPVCKYQFLKPGPPAEMRDEAEVATKPPRLEQARAASQRIPRGSLRHNQAMMRAHTSTQRMPLVSENNAQEAIEPRAEIKSPLSRLKYKLIDIRTILRGDTG